jgi:uncharacterized repeat protein (TIGR01451 family)
LFAGWAPKPALANLQDSYTIYYVAPICPGEPIVPCYTTIQEAVDAVDDPNDVIKVAEGSYNGVNYLHGLAQGIYIEKSLTLLGGYSTSEWDTPRPATQKTILDARGKGRGVVISGTVTVNLEGFHITGGDATGLKDPKLGYDSGAGIFVYTATTTISNCVIYSNTASTADDGYGGALFVEGGSTDFINNQVRDNVGGTSAGSQYGGVCGGIGFYLGEYLIQGNIIENNIGATNGDGMCGGVGIGEAYVTLKGNKVFSNTASLAGAGYAGGVFLNYVFSATMEGNSILSNTGSTVGEGLGGGIGIIESEASLIGNTIRNNVASDGWTGDGGGVYINNSTTSLNGNTITDNTGSTANNGLGGGVYFGTTVMRSSLQGTEEEDAGTAVYTQTFSGNLIQGNTASTEGSGKGGGIFLDGEKHNLENNTILSNTASLTGQGQGGGVGIFNSQQVTLTGNTLISNTASSGLDGAGGGIFIDDTVLAKIITNTILSNTGGIASTSGGGGVYIKAQTATIENNAINFNTGNIASDGLGGGSYMAIDSATVVSNSFNGNNASFSGEGQGGGLFIRGENATLRGNRFYSNTAGTSGESKGGGLYSNSEYSSYMSNTFESNLASASGEGTGGGMYAENESSKLTGNNFKHNTANLAGLGYGGGLMLNANLVQMERNLVFSNTASRDPAEPGFGGGMGVETVLLTMTNNIVAANHANNEGSGIVIDGAGGKLLHNTIADNHSGDSGVYIFGNADVLMTNTLIANNGLAISLTKTCSVILDTTLWFANYAHIGGEGTVISSTNIIGAPDFLDPENGDYHISEYSAARNNGINSGVPVDIDLETRPQDGAYDIGADEFLDKPRLEVTKKAHSDMVRPGEKVTYTLEVVNSGNVDLHATVTDTLPGQVSPTGTITWNQFIPSKGGSWTQELEVTVDEDYEGTLSNHLEVTSLEGAIGEDSAVVEAIILYELEVSKTADRDLVGPGEKISYTLRVTNTGSLPLNLTIEDLPPLGVVINGETIFSVMLANKGDVWVKVLTFTVRDNYEGLLTNRVDVTSLEGVTGSASVTVMSKKYRLFLPTVLNSHP